MPKRTTRTYLYKAFALVRAWLHARVMQLGNHIFATTDAAARRQGWQVIPIGAGLGRQYRDPRFDSLSACTRCGGPGARATGDPCQACGGTGRLVAEGQAADPPSPRST